MATTVGGSAAGGVAPASAGADAGALATLARRGLVKQTTDAASLARLLEGDAVTFYLGIDPTGPSLHAGHLVGLLAMAHLQRAGHQPVLLIGGATARVGDPSDKDDMRPLLPVETVARNAELMQRQVGRIIDLSRTIVVDNAAWLAELGYLDFLREIGPRFSVNRMLSFETYRRRLETGLSFLEFNYLLLQAYDFLVLHRRHGCLLQIGGDDQWANILAGVDLIRRVQRVEAHALTWPLVTTADGKKMGKTAAGALFLDPERVTPYRFYQYWINLPDADVAKLLAMLTLLPDAEVEELGRLRDQAVAAAKERLAMELTTLVHGAEEAARARETSRALFSGAGGDRGAMPSSTLNAADMETGMTLVELLVRGGLASSRSEARRLIRQGGAYVNDRQWTDSDQPVAAGDVYGGQLILRAGKKRHHRFVVGDTSLQAAATPRGDRHGPLAAGAP
jgi:tyrosyl-tRNA synthetase